MASSSKVISIFVIVFTLSQISSGKAEFRWNALELIRKDNWTVRTEQFDDPTFAYALCDDKPLVDSKRKCTIIVHEDVHNNDAVPKACTFTLEKASNGIIRVENFGDDRAIFVWSNEVEKNNRLRWTFRMGVIRMSTCEISETGLVVKANSKEWEYGDVGWHTFHIGILVYDETFDVVVQRAKACGKADDDRHCVYTYNSDGKRIGGPVTRYSPEDEDEFYQLKPSSRSSSDKGYLLITDGNAPRVFMLKPREDPKESFDSKMLWKLPENKDVNPVTSYSWNNGLIGICSSKVLDDKVSCLCFQMRQEGHSKHQMQFSVLKPSRTSSMIIFLHNLPGGGFFIVPLYSDDKTNFYSMSEVNANGRVVGEPMMIGSHSHTCFPEPVNTRIIVQDDGKYCMTIACVEEDKKKQKKILKTLTKCFIARSVDLKSHAEDRDEL